MVLLVRGEVESGFQTVRDYALPVYAKAIAHMAPIAIARCSVMLTLLAHNNDTNLKARGGTWTGCIMCSNKPKEITQQTQFLSIERMRALQHLDQLLIARNLSPGGSADLLAITWLLHPVRQIKTKTPS